MLFPIMIKVWAGAGRHDFRYIGHSLPSLLDSDLPTDARVILIDDCSTDPRVQPFLQELAAENTKVEVWTNPHNLGPNAGQAYNFPRVVEKFPDAEYFVLCDDDIIYHPGWLQRQIQVYEEAKQAGLNGVFTALNVLAKQSYASVRLPTSEVLLKERQMALNWFLPRSIYEKVGLFRASELAFDTDYANRMAVHKIPVICMKPSYVQNIGYLGAYQTDDTLTARDYVGRMGLSLSLSATRCAIQRRVRKAAETIHDQIPECGPKRFVRRLRKGRPATSEAPADSGN